MNDAPPLPEPVWLQKKRLRVADLRAKLAAAEADLSRSEQVVAGRAREVSARQLQRAKTPEPTSTPPEDQDGLWPA